MPYIIVKSYRKGIEGYRVRKLYPDREGKFKYFSYYPLTYDKALRQLRAIEINTYRE